MSGLDQEFETGVRLIRDAFSRKLTQKESEVVHLRGEVARKDAEIKELVIKLNHLESQGAQKDRKIAELQRRAQKLSVFKKHVLESFDDDELPPELARERSAVSGVEQNSGLSEDSPYVQRNGQTQPHSFGHLPQPQQEQHSHVNGSPMPSKKQPIFSPAAPSYSPIKPSGRGYMPTSLSSDAANFKNGSLSNAKANGVLSSSTTIDEVLPQQFQNLSFAAKTKQNDYAHYARQRDQQSSSDSLHVHASTQDITSKEQGHIHEDNGTSAYASDSNLNIPSAGAQKSKLQSSNLRNHLPNGNGAIHENGYTNYASGASATPAPQNLSSDYASNDNTVDGREYALDKRSLNFLQFTALLYNVKMYNSREQSRIRTLENVYQSIGQRHPDMFKEFEKLLS
ncbi:hypothetical protein MP638_003437 [Amoeboaphelidium occidentale]|nr:hypothetical protein MP638_003437 [Amoeboaphelidium occidentale]